MLDWPPHHLRNHGVGLRPGGQRSWQAHRLVLEDGVQLERAEGLQADTSWCRALSPTRVARLVRAVLRFKTKENPAGNLRRRALSHRLWQSG